MGIRGNWCRDQYQHLLFGDEVRDRVVPAIGAEILQQLDQRFRGTHELEVLVQLCRHK